MILGVDVETTGLCSNENNVTEIGAILWDTDHGTPVKFVNVLVDPMHEIPEEITKLTGITPGLIDKHGVTQFEALQSLDPIMQKADFILAHNAPFDKGFIAKLYEKNGLKMPEKIWIDSSVDVPYAEAIGTRKLVHLAAEHKFVNPFAHRAVTDVLTMLRICLHYDWATIIESAKQPTITIRAKVTYDDREKAKGTGYRWDGENKVWIKNIKAHRRDDEFEKARKLGFEIGDWKNG
jgi:DNA polymerase-3 subunit epsilon